VSDEEQPDRADLGQQPTLRTYPTLHPNERQLPAGDGLPPPSQPEFPGMEADLPYLGLTPKWVDGTAVGGCSFMIHVRHAAAAIASGPGASTWVAI
jgi:hypothetical protein